MVRRGVFIASVILLLLLLNLAGIYLYLDKKRSKLEIIKKDNAKAAQERIINSLINISHELRTPLTLIYAPVKQFLEKGELDQKSMFLLRSVLRQSQKMKNVIDLVIEVQKIDDGKEHMDFRPQLFNSWLEGIIGDFEYGISTKCITIRRDIESTSGVEVVFDHVKLNMAVSNLIINAFKYGVPESEIRISTSCAADGESVRVAVTNVTENVDAIDLEHIFSRYYMADNSQSGGSGIGLSFVKSIIEYHHGKIGVEKGCHEKDSITFWFELPVNLLRDTAGEECGCREEEHCLPAGNEMHESLYAVVRDNAEITSTLGKYSILIVDDDYEMRMLLKTTLSSYFKEIFVAGNGDEALKIIRKEYPSVILSDVMMSGMNGFQLCSIVKNDLEINHIPVVLITALGDSKSKSVGYSTGADAYVPKPFETDMLLSILVNNLKRLENLRNKYKGADFSMITAESAVTNKDEAFLLKLDNIINRHIGDENFNIAMLTRELCISRTSLYNKMKAISDVSINEYIIRKRIHCSCTLLKTTALSIKEVAFESGFSDQRYFSTTFKQIMNMTPTEYRKTRHEVDDAASVAESRPAEGE